MYHAFVTSAGALALALTLHAAEPAPGARSQSQDGAARITYLYDNTTAVAAAKADWGFACLVEARGGRVLFDAGSKPNILTHNAREIGVDLGRLDAVVMSHDHADHTAGLPALGSRPGLRLFYARGFSPEVVARLGASGATLVPVLKSTEVAPGFRTSDEFGTTIKEEALLVDTAGGLVVVVGCSHPGIVPMLQQIKASAGRPIHAVLGGFHLLQTPPAEDAGIVAAIKALGVERIGPTHCTGPEAIRLFEAAYGGRFIRGGVGTVITAGQ